LLSSEATSKEQQKKRKNKHCPGQFGCRKKADNLASSARVIVNASAYKCRPREKGSERKTVHIVQDRVDGLGWLRVYVSNSEQIKVIYYI
jgi:hypothetical protein